MHIELLFLSLYFSLLGVDLLFFSLLVVCSLPVSLPLELLKIVKWKAVSCYLACELLFGLQWFIVDRVLVALLSSVPVALIPLCLSVDSLCHRCFSWLCIIMKISGLWLERIQKYDNCITIVKQFVRGNFSFEAR